jgi:hypothetical protein
LELSKRIPPFLPPKIVVADLLLRLFPPPPSTAPDPIYCQHCSRNDPLCLSRNPNSMCIAILSPIADSYISSSYTFDTTHKVAILCAFHHAVHVLLGTNLYLDVIE